MGGVYVTYVANADKGQRHVGTLGCSFKTMYIKNTYREIQSLIFNAFCL